MANVTLMYLDPGELIPTRDNPRFKVDRKSPKYSALLDSIHADGVRVPGQARPHRTERGKYDLLDGARRHAVCVELGMRMPVLVGEWDDAEAWRIVKAANFGREDLSVLEQANAVRITLEKFGGDHAAAAAELGQSASWVARRAKLLDLSKKWMKEVASPDSHFFDWPAACLELIARLPADVQDALLPAEGWDQRRLAERSAKDLAKWIDREVLHLLAKAPFDTTDDKLLPRRPACVDCKRRSSCELLLFHDDEPSPEDLDKSDRCLDPSCWRAKAMATLKAAIKAEEAARGAPLEVFGVELSYSAREVIEEKLGRKPEYVEYGQKLRARKPKDATDAKEVFVVEPDGSGRVKWLVREKRARAGGRGSSGGRKSTGPDPRLRIERESVAEQFALAAGCLELARAVDAGEYEDAEALAADGAVLEKCVLYALEEGVMTNTRDAGFDWLQARLGLVVESKTQYGPRWRTLEPAKLDVEPWPAACALGLYECARRHENVFAGGKTGKKKAPGLPTPHREPAVLRSAADRFVIDDHFLESHLSANIAVIARELGVKPGATKATTMTRLHGAAIPPGAMTKDLAKAFGLAEKDLVVIEPAELLKDRGPMVMAAQDLVPDGWVRSSAKPWTKGKRKGRKSAKRTRTTKSTKGTKKKRSKPRMDTDGTDNGTGNGPPRRHDGTTKTATVHIDKPHRGLGAGEHTVTGLKVGRKWTRFTDVSGRSHKMKVEDVRVK